MYNFQREKLQNSLQGTISLQIELKHNFEGAKRAGRDLNLLSTAHSVRKGRLSGVKDTEVNFNNPKISLKPSQIVSSVMTAKDDPKSTKISLLKKVAKKIGVITSATSPTKSEVVHKGCTRTEADMIFISMVQSGPKHDFNTKRSLARFQFTDCLLNIADVKFVKTKICSNIVDAFEKLLKCHIIPFADVSNSLKFRGEYLLVESVDNAIRSHLNTIAKVYKLNSGHENSPSEKKTMSLSEWQGVWQIADIETRYPWITERAKNLAYCRSKAPCINQFTDENSFKRMTFCEFIEGIIRITHNVLLISNIDDAGEFIYRNANGISADDVAQELDEIIKLLQRTLTRKQLDELERNKNNDAISSLLTPAGSKRVVPSSDDKKHLSKKAASNSRSGAKRGSGSSKNTKNVKDKRRSSTG